MTLLDDYVKAVRESKGLNHQRQLAVLRNYINTTPEDNIINEIYRLQTIQDLRTLWEAGLNTILQHHSLNRYDGLQRAGL